MALLFTDGCGLYGAGASTIISNAALLERYDATAGSIYSMAGRHLGSGTTNAAITPSALALAYVEKRFAATQSVLIVGFGINSPNLNVADDDPLAFLSSAGTVLIHTRKAAVSGANYGYAFSTTSGTVLLTTPAVFVQNTWQFMEVKIVFGTTGPIEVRRNGVTVASATNLNMGATLPDRMRFSDSTNAGNSIGNKFQDMYVCDTTTARNNNFLGDVRIETLYPTSDGAEISWTPSTGVVHFSTVDEVPANTTTDYVESDTVGQRDLYGHSNLITATAAVLAVRPIHNIARSAIGIRTLKSVTRQSAVNYDSTDAFTPDDLLNVFKARQVEFTINPATGLTWTKAEVNAAEFGIKVET